MVARSNSRGRRPSRHAGRSVVGSLRAAAVGVMLLGVALLIGPAGAAAADAAANPAKDRVLSHLQAGEFGPALDAAETAKSLPEKRELLQLVAVAQADAGNASAARAALRRVPTAGPGDGALARAAMAGGGSQANFMPLMMLLFNTTSGEWEMMDGVGGNMMPFYTGVRVDPNGMLALLSKEDRVGRLKDLGLEARKADLNDDMARASSLRLVSLTRLEREVARRLKAGQPVLETMRHLAGLQKIQYVFVYPEQGEIVVGGPAEAWRYNEMGLPVGTTSGRPTLQLDDLVTVLRIFSPSGQNAFHCLIVPRQVGLAKVKALVEQSNARGPLAAGAVRHWVRQLQEALGEQDAVFAGVPTDSRVARAILEADYRMKLVGVGRLDGGPGIPSYFDLLSPKTVKSNPPALDALRWWLTMKYDGVMHSPDRNVFELVGSSVRCLCENELVTSDGTRIHTGKADAANQQFALNFTNHYEQLAARDSVFADLQNIFDLAMVAALLRHEQVQERTKWFDGVFAPKGAYRPARYEPPKTVMSVGAHRVYGGRDIIVQVAGGVDGDIARLLKDPQIYQEQVRLDSLARRGQPPQLPEGRWWWDAAE